MIELADPVSTCIFRSDATRHAVDTKGYAKLSVLNGQEVEELNGLFLSFTGGAVSNSEYGMYLSVDETDVNTRRALIARLYALLLPPVSRQFMNYKPIVASFLAKAPAEYGYTFPHQDWTFVDPPHRSINVWIALTDVTERNGAIGFIDGSHRMFQRPVGSRPAGLKTATQGHESLLYEYLRFVPLQAGEAVVFDTGVIHGAGANRSSGLRSAVTIALTPANAPLFHHVFCLNGSQVIIGKFAVDPAFFENHTPTELRATCRDGRYPPGFDLISSQPDNFTTLSAEEMRRLCEALGAKRNGHRIERPAPAKRESSHRFHLSSLLDNRRIPSWIKQRAKRSWAFRVR